jgi:hypothetical protein
MKLYTEEQVKKAIEMARSSYNFFSTPFIYGEHEVIQQLKSIELPSDEEISAESMDLFGKNSTSINDILQYKAFKRGAKWMRDKIQGGNK